MRIAVAAACLVTIAVAGCQALGPASAQDPVVDIGRHGDSAITVAGKAVTRMQLLEMFIAYRRTVSDERNPSRRSKVIVRADPDSDYDDLASVMVATGRGDLEELILNGFMIPLPQADSPRASSSDQVTLIKIGLFDDPRNNNIDIVLGEKQLVKEWLVPGVLFQENPLKATPLSTSEGKGQDFGPDFDALRHALTESMASSLTPKTTVLIAPTMATRCKYVLQAANIAHEAGFTNIHFAVPSE
jgi:biopolymer transport protein ExbD